MTTQVMATVVDGQLKLDEPVELPNDSRVKLVLEVEETETEEARRERKRRALADLLRFSRETPINSGGMYFTRDQLHERD